LDTERRFRSSTNALILKGLFLETSYTDLSFVAYTLKDVDHRGYPSLYRLFLETNDPTEYKFATTHLDGLLHWEKLCDCTWFKPYVERWRRELELRMKSIALSRIMAEAKASSREAFNANKYLLEKGWEPKDGPKHSRGRPTKEQIQKAASDAASASQRLTDDFERITAFRTTN
jgi:hypothetical protein